MSNKEKIKNVPLLLAKQKYLKRFKQLLIDLQNFSINGHFKQTVQRFRSCIQPDKAHSESQLPFLSYDINSRKADKDKCVLCMLSHAVQGYWELCDDNLVLESGIDTLLTILEGYAKNGRKAYKIAGEFPRFYLEKV